MLGFEPRHDRFVGGVQLLLRLVPDAIARRVVHRGHAAVVVLVERQQIGVRERPRGLARRRHARVAVPVKKQFKKPRSTQQE